MQAELIIAEVLYETGEVHFRFSRMLSEDRTRWIRHGLFCEYAKNGQVISEGTYEFGKESGSWRDYYSNGQLAAEGRYESGEEVEEWRYWDEDGNPTQGDTGETKGSGTRGPSLES